MIPNASVCAWPPVMPRKSKRQEFGAEKGLLRPCKKIGTFCPQIPELLGGFQQSTFKGKVREGHG